MGYLKFDKNQLVNLEYSLQREILRSNRAGCYICTTLPGCNTRKYHGLLVCPLDEHDGDRHVLLSSLDESVIQRSSTFNLGIHKYEGDRYEPRGHKYIRDFELEISAITTYRIGDVVLTRERVLVEDEHQLLINYTLEDANSPTILRLRPFLAFRNIHDLSKANHYANTKYTEIENGIKVCLYEGYPDLSMQFSKKAEFIPTPNWFYGIEYQKEQERGYDYKEDLFVPGYFEIPIKKGETIIFSASTVECAPNTLKQKYAHELKKRIGRDSFITSLTNVAQQFIFRKEQDIDLLAGFPWYGSITRQTFIALPALTLDLNDQKTFEKIVDTQLQNLKDGLFPKFGGDKRSFYDSIDSPLWFFWTIQQYYRQLQASGRIWKKYGAAMKLILSAYKDGTDFNIKMLDNGLINGKTEGVALTWMDSYVDGNPVVQRGGQPVEVNALWYNAICLALELATKEGDQEFISEWQKWPAIICKSFNDTYWSEPGQYLADCVDGENTDWSVRPNMLIAAALEFTPLNRERQKAVLSMVKRELLTPRGIRTLSPRDPRYVGLCACSIQEREKITHQGMAWPWFISFFTEAYLKIHGRGGLSFIKKIIAGFEEEMTGNCIGTISEMYNGNPPHKGEGAISQGWSVAALIHAYKLIEKMEEKSLNQPIVPI